MDIQNSVQKLLELQSVSGAKKKRDILEENKGDSGFCLLLYYVLNPMITYKLSRKTLDHGDILPDHIHVFPDIFECCNYLSRKSGLGEFDRSEVRTFLHRTQSDSEKEFYKKLLTKTLRLGVTAKTVNKVIPGLIPEWEVQQAYPIESYPIEDGTEFWLTQKLNGTRATYYDGVLYARSGVPYSGLDHIIEEIKKVNTNGLVLDGELTLLYKSGMSDNEAFRTATGIINSDTDDKKAIQYTIFDAVDSVQFELGYEDGDPYSKRRELLDELSEKMSCCKYISILPVLYHGTDQSMIPKLLDQMVSEDKEGLVANLDVPYKRTRHRGILKIKRFYTMDLKIIGAEEGSGRLSGTLGALVLDFKGNEIRVGSGFSDNDRNRIWILKDEVIGLLCEVKYKEISRDRTTGNYSLQFPVYVGIRTDKDEVSYG